MLDKLCTCTSPEEEVQMREMAAVNGVPSHLVPLHDYVAQLLIKHGIASWHLLRTRFHGELWARGNIHYFQRVGNARAGVAL